MVRALRVDSKHLEFFVHFVERERDKMLKAYKQARDIVRCDFFDNLDGTWG